MHLRNAENSLARCENVALVTEFWPGLYFPDDPRLGPDASALGLASDFRGVRVPPPKRRDAGLSGAVLLYSDFPAVYARDVRGSRSALPTRLPTAQFQQSSNELRGMNRLTHWQSC
jgi:hypothetical protein